MKWRRIRRRLKNFLLGRVTLNLVPHSRGSVRSFRFPRIVLFLLSIGLLGYLVSITYFYYNYLDRYQQARTTIVELQELKVENMALKTGLNQVVKETEEMKKVLLELEKKGADIEALISDTSIDEPQMQTRNLVLFNYQLFDDNINPLGGGGELLETDGFELLSRIRGELRMLRMELPLQETALDGLEHDVEDYNALARATPTGWPLNDDGKGYVSSNFGLRKDPVTNQTSFHEGLDIGVWYGTPVIATADGKVTFADWKGSYGRVVYIDHGYGFLTKYAHNSKLVVQQGEMVKRGDIIAYSGNSGKSTGPHLHYEVRINGVPKNPRDFVKN